MFKFVKILFLTALLGNLLVSCSDDMDDVIKPASGNDIKEFIWRGMNNIYLYKADVPDLADDRFASQEELNEFLDNFSSPESLFYDGLVAPQDRFSFLVDNYIELEQAFEGISVANGMQFGLVRLSSTSDLVIGYVRYVLPNTSAAVQGVERGDLFNTIDGERMTLENYSRLLEPDSYTIGLAEISNSEIVPTGEQVLLEKVQYTEDPVYIAKIFETSQGKVGYLMYNSFTRPFDPQLNAAFADFKSQGVTNLIVDLRYNGGGSVETAVDLASMITGQFEGEVFAREQWNTDYQAYFEENEPERLVNLFNSTISTGEKINSLGLTKVYIITTLRTASASELVINGLAPYIDVVQIGENTTGKFQASVTLYDSEDFGREGANPGHTYAIQPLIFKTLNSVGNTDYVNGLDPDIELREDVLNLGILGDPSEPLLQAALNSIEGISPAATKRALRTFKPVGESGMKELLYQKMYIDELPASLRPQN